MHDLDGRGLEAAGEAFWTAITEIRVTGAIVGFEDGIRAAISAYLASSPNIGEVEVRELEWKEITSAGEDGPPEPTGDWEATSIVGGYHVYIFEDHYEVTRTDGDYVQSWCGDADEAKAAAQIDFADRIRSQLVPSPRQHSSQVVSQSPGHTDVVLDIADHWNKPLTFTAPPLGFNPHSGVESGGWDDDEPVSTPLTETAKAEHVGADTHSNAADPIHVDAEVVREPAEERFKAAMGRYETPVELARGLRNSAHYWRQREPSDDAAQPRIMADFHERAAIALERLIAASPQPSSVGGERDIETIIDAVMAAERVSPKTVPLGMSPVFIGMQPDADGAWVSRVDVAKRLRAALPGGSNE